MQTSDFVPNWERNKGKDFSKHGKNGAEERPEPKKKTVIKNAIKTADEVPEKIAEVVKKKRGRPRKNTQA